MGRRKPRNPSQGQKSGKVTNDSTTWRSPRNPSRTSLESEPPQSPRSPQSGRHSRKRSRVEFEEDSKSSFNLDESSVESSVFCGQCQAKEKELTRLLEELSIRDKIKEEYEEMKAKYEEEKRLKEEALTRLSAMASSKLLDNNPNIADLSDPNRPTKIAEKLSELYDNEWTDAFDAVQDDMSEKEIIDFLLDILMRTYQACKEIASENYLEKVQSFIEFPVQGEPSVPSQCELPDDLKQQIKQFRKLRALHVIKDVQKVIKDNLQSKYDGVKEVRTYKTRCVELCWLMVVQDPPLALSATSPEKFDTNLFKDYTKRGQYAQYVVWPSLHLHEGGSLLTKGIAQGCNNPLVLDN